MCKFYPFLVFALCAACGGTFSASNGSGGSAPVGQAGEGSGGDLGTAGSGDAGQLDTGGASSAGEGPTMGGRGSVAGGGGVDAGGASAGSGGTASTDCAALKQQYASAVDKARACDRGSTDQCSTSSVAQPIEDCGCPVLINSKSEYAAAAKATYQAYQDGNCAGGSIICNIACLPPTSANCERQSMGSGNGFTCVGNGFGTR